MATKGKRRMLPAKKPQQKKPVACVCEEGTWTPILTFGGASTGIAYTRQEGYYRKAGSLIVIWYWLVLSSKGNSPGTAFIENLPFPAADNGGMTSPVLFFSMAGSFASVLHAHDVAPHRLVLRGLRAAAADYAVVTNADFSNTTNIRACFSYFSVPGA
jgi:hypothetical protein